MKKENHNINGQEIEQKDRSSVFENTTACLQEGPHPSFGINQNGVQAHNNIMTSSLDNDGDAQIPNDDNIQQTSLNNKRATKIY